MKQQILLSQASRKLFLLIAILLMSANSVVRAQTTTFTYQGRLTDGGTPATGSYDLQFALFDSASSGGQIGATQTVPSVPVSSGIFTVSLDFGAGAFSGANRFLEISARLSGGGSFTLLAPRQQITATPYAVRSLLTNAADALTGACVGCVQDANINGMAGSKVSGPISVNSVPAGSNSYVQNTDSTTQASSNFNISGNGRAGGLLSGDTVNATTAYLLGFSRVFSVAGSFNTFVGVGTGGNNNTGTSNAFFGSNAGLSNTAGHDNTFVGKEAGFSNLGGAPDSGSFNTFVGSRAGEENTYGYSNAFFGYQAGTQNTGGFNNAFFGYLAGNSNQSANSNSFFGSNAGQLTTASNNSFFGQNTGLRNTTGDSNSFFGVFTGINNSNGSGNTFFGFSAGNNNITGDLNTMIGDGADVGFGSSNLNHATAIGAGAVVKTSNTIVLGREDRSDFVLIPGFLTIPNLAAAGTTQLCLNAFDRVGNCSSSLRYKTNLAAYSSGLSVINRLRPISFTWKEGGMRDVGFGAEDVEQVDPLLVTYNKQGQVEGVKYDRINVVLVNAIREQQDQIERQQAEVTQQQNQIEALRTANVALNARLRDVEKVLRQGAGSNRRRR